MKIAVCQFGATSDIAQNTAKITDFARTAHGQGADLLVCPEAAMIRLPDKHESLVGKVEDLDGTFGQGLARASAEYDLGIVAGGFTPADESRVTNTLYVASNGSIVAHYDKIHLYDAFSDKESDKVRPGPPKPVVTDIAGARVGLATCYDLRFPEVFRLLVDQGSEIIVLPAAWVKGSMKEEHWLTLLRARAIENTVVVVGSGEAGERCIGRSTVFDPMGRQLTDLGGSEGIAVVDVDLDTVRGVRKVNPSLQNRRFHVEAGAPEVVS